LHKDKKKHRIFMCYIKLNRLKCLKTILFRVRIRLWVHVCVLSHLE